MALGVFECLPSLRDLARSKVDKPSIEVGQGHERWLDLIEIWGLIESTTPGEDLLGSRFELFAGHLFCMHGENVDARR